jgi:hypothetical protein
MAHQRREANTSHGLEEQLPLTIAFDVEEPTIDAIVELNANGISPVVVRIPVDTN